MIMILIIILIIIIHIDHQRLVHLLSLALLIT